MIETHATTILAVKKDGQVAMAGDGQVTLGQSMIMKHTARKVRRLYDGKIVAGFAGATADAFTLFELFEAKLKEFRGNLQRSAVELTKEWRKDKYLRRLEAMLLVSDGEHILLLSGNGDVFEPDDDVAAIGSVPLTPYGTPSTSEVPDAIEPYLEEHDVMLLENHGALAVGSDVVTAFYRMESLELWAKITINAVILGGSYDISRENIDKLIDLRGFYRVTGRHPGYKKYPRREKGAPTDT